MAEPSVQISLPKVQVKLRSAYDGGASPPRTYRLGNLTDQSSGWVWAVRDDNRFSLTWTLEAVGPEATDFTIIATGDWRLTNWSNQAFMREAQQQVSAQWRGEGYRDGGGGLSVRIKSVQDPTRYLCLYTDDHGIILPETNACNLNDTPTLQNAMWRPDLVSGSQGILDRMFPDQS